MNYLNKNHSSYSKSKFLERVRQIILSEQYNQLTTETKAKGSKNKKIDSKCLPNLFVNL